MSALSSETIERLSRERDPSRSELRRRAYEVFAETPMPSPQDETWKYADLALDFGGLEVADAPGDRIPAGPFAAAVTDPAALATVVDGFVTIDDDGDGLLRSDSSGGTVSEEIDKFAAARRAFGIDRVIVDVPAAMTVDRPIVVDLQSATAGTIAFPSIAIGLGADSDASVIVLHRSGEDVDVVSVPEIVADVGDAARLRLTSIQIHGGAATSVAHQRVRVGRDATLRGGEVGLGGRFARVDYGVDHVGDGSSTEIVGLYFGEHAQTLDYRVVMNHVGRSTSSDVFLKGAVEDESRSVFTGLLRIEHDATRTSAFETNRNLVLSAGATAHSVPNLEILCDDVVCGHGSSVGPLEEEHLYYLMSRGLSRQRAERLLVRGFFAEVIDRLPVMRLTEPISTAVNRRFVEAQEAGRVG